MSSLAQLRRIAAVEFAAIVVQTDMLGANSIGNGGISMGASGMAVAWDS